MKQEITFPKSLSLKRSFKKVSDLSNKLCVWAHKYVMKKCTNVSEQHAFLSALLAYNQLHSDLITEELAPSEFVKKKKDLERTHSAYLKEVTSYYPVSVLKEGLKVKSVEQHLIADATDGYPKDKLFYRYLDNIDLMLGDMMKQLNEYIRKQTGEESDLSLDQTDNIKIILSKVDNLSDRLVDLERKDDPLFYSLREAEKVTGIKHSTLRGMANRQEIKAVKRDPKNEKSSWLIPRKEIERLRKSDEK